MTDLGNLDKLFINTIGHHLTPNKGVRSTKKRIDCSYLAIPTDKRGGSSTINSKGF